LDLYIKYKDDIEDVVSVINSSDNDFLDELINSEYYIKDLLERYLSYKKENSKLDADEVISVVNTNTDYEYYTHSIDVDMSKDTLILVNKYYKLASDYEADDLVALSSSYSRGSSNKLRKVAHDAFVKLSDDAYAEGYNIYSVSAYRSYSYQVTLFDNCVSIYGLKQTLADTAKPGFSEHQTGLSLDVNLVDTSFENTDEFKWLQKNAYKYGFIIRYPKGKDDLTGYVYEPWHYRYVGVEAATYIYEHDITFDEYYAYFVNGK
jgi:D-alanyl-D-alanine carboxypeptidase